MKSLKSLPYWALLFLLWAYIASGWYVASATPTWQRWLESGFCSPSQLGKSLVCLFLGQPVSVWSATFLGIVLLVLALVHPISKVKSVFGNWLQSDTKAFLSVIVISFLIVVVLTRSDLMAEGFALLAPGLLVRLELRLAGYSDWHSFAIILMVCAIGYTAGLWLFQHYALKVLVA